jgi:DNA polymerase-4
MRRIAHVDMDAFFAAIEEQRNPALAGKPVVIGGRGDPRERGVVSTASYEARRYGIRSGMPLRTAYRLCPEAIFLPVDYKSYATVSARIKAALRDIASTIEDAGIDEAYLDISDLSGSAEAIGKAIKARIRDETGLSCSVGIAPNKLLAKLASDMQKPDGLTVLTAADIEPRVWPLPARKLLGVGPKTEASLARMGIRTIGDLAAAPLDLLIGRFGNAHGRYLHESARGIDESPLVTVWTRHSIGHEITFQRDVDERAMLVRVLKRLAREVAEEAKGERLRGRTVTTKLRFADFETLTRQTSLPRPTNATATIQRAAVQCLERIVLAKKVRLVGVRLSGFEDDTARLAGAATRSRQRKPGRQKRIPPRSFAVDR